MRRVWLIGLCALLISVPAAAQETRGSIEGVVKDMSGGILPGVTVEARSPVLVGIETATTNADGIYRFPALPPGIYEVTAKITGFTTRKVENIQLLLGQLLKIDFQLEVGGVAETVQVTADSPIIDVKQNAATLAIPQEIIDRIPKGRDFLTVLNSAPGTSNEAKAGGWAIDGATGSENRFIIDGLDTTNLRNGTSNKELLLDFVAEVQVKSSGYNAEYRATTGGVISAVTRSGSNSWHGGFGVHYNNDRWLGDVRPSLRLNPANQRIAEYTSTPRDPAFTAEPVFDVGGPILRDRAWFFAGYVPQVSRTDRTVRFNSTGETKTFESNSEDHNLNYNITSQLRDNMRVKFAASNERSFGGQSLPGKEPNGTSNSTPSQFPNPVTTNSKNDTYVGEMAWVVSPRFFVNANLGYMGIDSWQVTETEFQSQLRHTFSGSNLSFPDIPASLKQLSGYSDLAASTRNVRDKFTRLGFNLDGTYYASFRGQHTIKAGFQFERLGNDVLTGAQAPTVALSWNAARITLDEPPRQVRGTYGFYTVSRFYTEGNIHSNNVGLFVQDAWAVNNQLTLNLGIRADSETIPSYRPENPGLEFGLGDKIAPRAGFAYDIKGDGKWKAYGSWGMFYDISKLEMPRGAWGAEHWIDYHYTLDTFDWPSINCEGPVGSGCPGTFIELADRRHVSNEPDNFLVDPNLKPIRTQELTFGVDHELNRTMSVGVRYAHKWLDRTIEDVGIQVAGVGEIFMIANPGFGIAEFSLAGNCPSCPAQPKAERTYDGLEFRVRKRLSNRWSMNTSYLYSRIYGNYSGLSSSDENGRNSPSVLRFFDGLYMSFDQTGTPIYGRLQTDRPHQFKFQGTYDLPWGIGLGADYLLETGTLQQSTVTIKSVPVFDEGRGNLGRSPVFSQTNLAVFYTRRLIGSTELNLNLNVINLFDQDTVTRYFTARYRDQLPVGDTQFFAGFNAQQVAAANPNIRPDPRFLMPDQYQGSRSIRVQARLSF